MILESTITKQTETLHSTSKYGFNTNSRKGIAGANDTNSPGKVPNSDFGRIEPERRAPSWYPSSPPLPTTARRPSPSQPRPAVAPRPQVNLYPPPPGREPRKQPNTAGAVGFRCPLPSITATELPLPLNRRPSHPTCALPPPDIHVQTRIQT